MNGNLSLAELDDRMRSCGTTFGSLSSKRGGIRQPKRREDRGPYRAQTKN